MADNTASAAPAGPATIRVSSARNDVAGDARGSNCWTQCWSGPETGTPAARECLKAELHYHCSAAVEIACSLGCYPSSPTTALETFQVTFAGSADKPSMIIKAAAAPPAKKARSGSSSAAEGCSSKAPLPKARPKGESDQAVTERRWATGSAATDNSTRGWSEHDGW